MACGCPRSFRLRRAALRAFHLLMPDSTPPDSATFKLTVTNDGFASGDERWAARVDSLLDDLRESGGHVRKEVTPVAGQKGGIEEIILALGSSGAIAGAVAVFKIWFKRAPESAINIDGTIGRKKVKLRITGKNIDDATIREALKVAAK